MNGWSVRGPDLGVCPKGQPMLKSQRSETSQFCLLCWVHSPQCIWLQSHWGTYTVFIQTLQFDAKASEDLQPLSKGSLTLGHTCPALFRRVRGRRGISIMVRNNNGEEQWSLDTEQYKWSLGYLCPELSCPHHQAMAACTTNLCLFHSRRNMGGW